MPQNSVQNFYELLSVPPTATADEIKRAFRTEIARYHPDKVQHLGKEFQEMAASRAAALTEAYRTLTNPELRAEYDKLHGPTAVTEQAPAAVNAAEPRHGPPSVAPPSPPPHTPHRSARPHVDTADRPPPRFASERRDRDGFVRKATLDRFRHALAAEVGAFEELPARAFDFDAATKSRKLFSREGGQRYAVKFVACVDRLAMQEAWNAAQKAGAPICLFVMGNGMAPVRELSDAVSAARRRTRARSNICLVPVDVRDWSAHVPADAPAACKNVLKRLRELTAV